MLSYWPSLSLLAFFLAAFLECRVVGGRVTMRLSGFLAFFVYGCIGASLFSLLLQQLPLFEFGWAEYPGSDLAMSAAWLAGPPIEELAKALPLIVLAFFTTAWRRLSIADLTLAGFASGAGFGFVENNLKVLANGTLPNFQHLSGFGFETAQSAVAGYAVYFAGHPVYPALFGLAAGIGLRIFPARHTYAWIPAALVFLLATFDHGMYNWNVMHPAVLRETFAGPSGPIEAFYLLTFHGQLEIWLLPLALVAAQVLEARLCARAVGRRADLWLPFEFRQWVMSEWFFALRRLRLGRAAFAHMLAYFRHRRAFMLATLEARRNPLDRALALHTKQLERRLMQERAILLEPPRGVWLPPRTIVWQDLKEWAWRMRWVLAFDGLFVLLFMFGNSQQPLWLSEFLFGTMFTAIIVTAGLAFTVWRVYGFLQLPRLDPVVCDGAAFADYHTRSLLLAASLVGGISPALSLLLSAKSFVLPGAAYFSGNLAVWIHQGGNLHAVMGLGAIGGTVRADPRPAGGALRSDIVAGGERIRGLEALIEENTSLFLSSVTSASPEGKLDELIELMFKLDIERDAQGQRKLALDEDKRQLAELQVKDLDQAVQAVKDEFELLETELNKIVTEERALIAAFEEARSGASTKILESLDLYDSAHRMLSERRRDLWLPHRDLDWALRIVEITDETALPVLKTLLSELEGFASQTSGERADTLNAAIERIRTAQFVSTNTIGAGTLREETEIAPEFHETPVPEEVLNLPASPVEPSLRFLSEEPPIPASFEGTVGIELTDTEPDVSEVVPPQERSFVQVETRSEPELASVAVEADEPEPVLHPSPAEPAQQPVTVPGVEASLLACIGAPGWSEDDHQIADGQDAGRDDAALLGTRIAPLSISVLWECLEADGPAGLNSIVGVEFEEPSHAQLQELLNLPPPEVPEPEQEDVADPILLACMGAPGWSVDEPEIAGEHADPDNFVLAAHHIDSAPIFVRWEWTEARESDQGRAKMLTDVDFEDPLHTQLHELLNLPPLEVPELKEEDLFDPILLACIGAPGWSIDEVASEDNAIDRIGTPPSRLEVEASETSAHSDWTDPAGAHLVHLDAIVNAGFEEPLHAQLQELLNLPPPEVPETAPEHVADLQGQVSDLQPPTHPDRVLSLDSDASEPNRAHEPDGEEDLKLYDIYAKLLRVEAATMETAREVGAAHKRQLEDEPAPSENHIDKCDGVELTKPVQPSSQSREDLAQPEKPAPQREGADLEKTARRPEPPMPENVAATKASKPVIAPAQAPVAQTSDVLQTPNPLPATERKSPASGPAASFGVRRKKVDAEIITLPTRKAKAGPAEDTEAEEPIRTRSRKSREGIDDIPSVPSRVQSEEPDEHQDSGSARGVGRGKVIKQAGDKKAKSLAPPPNSANFRSAKFYNSGNEGIFDAEDPETEHSQDDLEPKQSKRSQKSALAEALSEYFSKNGETPPPMHTVDSETFQKIAGSGRLETARKGTAPWTFSEIPRRGDVAIRLRRGAEKFVEFIPSTVTFGQTPRYYSNRVGVGEPETYVPVEHLEYFDVGARKWLSFKR